MIGDGWRSVPSREYKIAIVRFVRRKMLADENYEESPAQGKIHVRKAQWFMNTRIYCLINRGGEADAIKTPLNGRIKILCKIRRYRVTFSPAYVL